MKTCKILLAAVLLTGLLGCTQDVSSKPVAGEKSAELAAYGISNTDAGIIAHQKESALFDESLHAFYQAEDAKPEVTITFQGEELTGTYVQSTYKLYDLNPRHIYQAGDVKFDIDAKTGELVMLNQFQASGETKTYEECEALAKEFAAKYIDTTKLTQKYQKNAYDDSIFEFVWYRTTEDIVSGNYFQVTIDTSGRMSFVDFTAVRAEQAIAEMGEAAYLEQVKKLAGAESKELADKKLAAMYEGAEGEITKELLGCEIVYCDGNRFGIIYRYEVSSLVGESLVSEETSILIY